ncbi:MAG: D-alanyl-D-alanine carboxypeptidase/D-alanyl-D-alanine-endopeptidase [Planctomycetota bacterium]
MRSRPKMLRTDSRARTRPCRLALVLPLLAVLLVLPRSIYAQKSALQQRVAAAEAMGARTGIAVCDGEGRVLYRHRAGEAFAPASNMKLLTACGLLQGLGADFVFRTRCSVENGVLVLDASGDPNWLHQADAAVGGASVESEVFAKLASALRVRGIYSVRGISLRPGSFVGPTRPADWPADQFYAYYAAPTGPFLLNEGVFWLALQPGDGPQARVELLSPRCDMPLTGSVRVVGTKKGATYGAIDKGDSVRVRGKIYRKSPRVRIRTSMSDPTVWFERALRAALRTADVRIEAAAEPRNVKNVYVHETPLLPAIRRILEDSSNVAAEQCVRVLGATVRNDGSLVGGMQELEAQIAKLCGKVPEPCVLRDASGLSRTNRLTPGLLTVAMIQNKRSAGGGGDRAAALLDRLPVAGRTGTLRRRFGNSDLVGRVRAKTGWIRGASSLSGVVERRDGTRRWFSILMSYGQKPSIRNKDLKILQEQMVAAIDAMESAQ